MYYCKSKPKANQYMHLLNTDAQLYTKQSNYLSIKCKLSTLVRKTGRQTADLHLFFFSKPNSQVLPSETYLLGIPVYQDPRRIAYQATHDHHTLLRFREGNRNRNFTLQDKNATNNNYSNIPQ